MTKYIVVHTHYSNDTLLVNYNKLPVDEAGEFVWDDTFKVSSTKIRKNKLEVIIYFLNEYKLAIDRASVIIPRKELIGNDDKRNEPPGIFVK